MSYAYAEAATPAVNAAAAVDEQQKLLAYAPLVKRVVRQLSSQVGGVMGEDDMLQIGFIGLLDALRRYGAPDERFGGYARSKVRGAILDELRRQDWRPRTLRQQSHRIRDGIRQLTRSLGREPTQAEIVSGLGVSADALQKFQMAQNAEDLVSFDELLQDGGQLSEERRHSPESQFVVRRSIEQALVGLNEREQRVVQLYYEFDLNLAEIAAVLDLTEARICQINKSALAKMRAVLEEQRSSSPPQAKSSGKGVR
jgi:RNA polymerase sigma factor for flagellar operon FliA